jgi:hypothetical protein
MITPERVSWYDGQESLAEAGRTLLENRHLDMVVVRDVGTIGLREALGTKPVIGYSFGELRDLLFAEVPALDGLDQVVTQWWAEQPLQDAYRLHTLRDSETIRAANRGIELHIDEPLYDIYEDLADTRVEGPLTFSLRVDNLIRNQRIFRAMRTHRSYLDRSGIDIDAATELCGHIRQRFDTKDDSGLTVVEQRPDDLVMFVNHPFPTIHAVNNPFRPRTGERPAKALVCSYELTQTIQ